MRNIPAGHATPTRPVIDAAAEQAVYRRIDLRIVPVIMIAYVLAFLDRINVGYAQLQMKQSLGFSDAVYGVGAGIFFLGQFIEGNILQPKLVGKSVGLHPVWLLFALSAFGTLFGFVGMLVAVPVAAALGVLARFAIEQYKTSRLYTGLEHPVQDEDAA